MPAASSIADKDDLGLSAPGGTKSKIIGLGRAYLQGLVAGPSIDSARQLGFTSETTSTDRAGRNSPARRR